MTPKRSWNYLWAPRSDQPSAAASDATEAELAAPAVEAGVRSLSPKVALVEYHHALVDALGARRVRTFVTRGLAAWRRPELRATVPAAWGDGEVGAMLDLLAQRAHLTGEGQPMALGGCTGFTSGDLGGGRLLGLTYGRGGFIAGIPGAEAMLAAVLLSTEEYGLAKRGLATRVLGRLAERARYFPFPPCWELRDVPVLGEAEQANSLLERLSVMTWQGDVRVTQVSERDLVVSLPPSAPEPLRELGAEHPALAMFLLMADLAPDADGQLVWFHGATAPRVNVPGASLPQRLGHSFVLFVGGDGCDHYRLIEDGAVVMLTPASFERLREALGGGDLTLPLDGDLTLRVQHRPVEVVDPSTGGPPRPADGARPAVGRVRLEGIVLLMSEQESAERLMTPEVRDFIKTIERVLDRVAGEYPVTAPLGLGVRLTLLPAAPPRAEVTPAGDAVPALLAPLHGALAALAPVAVRAEVRFGLEFTVHPHSLDN